MFTVNYLEIKKIRIATLSILMIFLSTALFLPAEATTSPILIPGHTPTYVGPASKFLEGPFRVAATALSAQLSILATPSLSIPKYYAPFHQRPWVNKGTQALVAGPTLNPAIPIVDCTSAPTPECDLPSTSNGGATTEPLGLNAVDSHQSNPIGLDIEPPDQGLCAGNGYVMEVLNIGELRVTDLNFRSPSAVIPLDNLMGLTPHVPQFSSAGDIQCLYDYDNGGHWFISEIVSNSTWASGGPFGGCFVAVPFTCMEGIAVSTTNNPLGSYNVYFLGADYVNPKDPGGAVSVDGASVGTLLNDFAKPGLTRDAYLFFYDEFNLGVSPTSGFGQYGFNGAQEFAFNKQALESGLPSTRVNVAQENMGTDLALYPSSLQSGANCNDGETCWYAQIPAEPPDPTQYDNSHGGSGFIFGALDFYGLGDSRVAVWYWQGLSCLNSFNAAACSTATPLGFGGQVFQGTQIYYNPGYPYALFAAPQKAGPIPLGTLCATYGAPPLFPPPPPSLASTQPCPEGGIETNGDFATQVAQAQNQVWASFSTVVYQQLGSSAYKEHFGGAYWVIRTSSYDVGLPFSITDQAYVTALHEELEFPAIAAADTASLGAVMTFTLSGNISISSCLPTCAGGFYPSTAFGQLTATSHGFSSKTIYIADLGQSPQDGFTEYAGYPPSTATRPRWGDYSWAVYVPSVGRFYFASEYIQSPNCSLTTFKTDPTCGGTRERFANWGSSVNYVT